MQISCLDVEAELSVILLGGVTKDIEDEFSWSRVFPLVLFYYYPFFKNTIEYDQIDERAS